MSGLSAEHIDDLFALLPLRRERLAATLLGGLLANPSFTHLPGMGVGRLTGKALEFADELIRRLDGATAPAEEEAAEPCACRREELYAAVSAP